MYDVMIAGYGPTGMLAAVLLGRAGHRVAVFERYRQLYNLPRVGIVHDDVLHMFQEVGCIEAIAPAMFFLPTYELANKGRILLPMTSSRTPRMAGRNSSRSISRRSRPSSTASQKAFRPYACSRATRSSASRRMAMA